MIFKLDKNEYSIARSLFRHPHLELVIDAVIAGNAKGEIWVDDQLHPQTACLWDRECRYYFAGYDDNQTFNADMKEILSENAPRPYLVTYCTSDSWENKLPIMFSGRPFVKRQRCFYELKQSSIPNRRNLILPGYSISRIDRQLLESQGLVNLNYLLEEINSMWPSIDAFLENAFGFCSLYNENEIVCWCTGEYAGAGQLGIGIETMRNHQRKGLATLTAYAFAEHCLSNGIKAHWDCWTDNIPSMKVAQKTGFDKILDYYAYQGQ